MILEYTKIIVESKKNINENFSKVKCQIGNTYVKIYDQATKSI